MIIRTLHETRASDHNVRSDGWESARLLVKDDGMGFSMHVTTLEAGAELHMHYQNHVEAVLVLEGNGVIEDLGTGKTHALSAGSLYALDQHDKHILRPETQMLTVCVFNPPVTGKEVHDETGAYPADTAASAQPAPGS